MQTDQNEQLTPYDEETGEALASVSDGDLIEFIWSVRRDMWKGGFRPVSIYNRNVPASKYIGSPGKQPAGGKAWQEHAKANPPWAVQRRPDTNALNTGILCNGLYVFDLDIDDPAIVKAVRSLIEKHLGKAPVRFRCNSSKIAMLYRAAVGEPHKQSLTGISHSKSSSMKIEILGWNNQFVAHGIHPSGADLEWEDEWAPGNGLSVAELLVVNEQQIVEVMEALAPLIGSQPVSGIVKSSGNSLTTPSPRNGNLYDSDKTANPLDVAAAMEAIPNSAPADWDFWKKLGLATFMATDGSHEGFSVWAAWSAKNPSHDEAKCGQEWEAMRRSPPDRIGAGTLFKMAKDAVPGWRAPSWGTSFPPATGSATMFMPFGFEMRLSGLYYIAKAKPEENPLEPALVSAPFEVLGECRDSAGSGWGIVLRWKDKAGSIHEQIIPRQMLPGRTSGDAIAALLEKDGLRCSANTQLLKLFLSEVKTPKILTTVETTGWHPTEDGGHIYALANGTIIGKEGHGIILRPELRKHGVETASGGTLEEWKYNVASYAEGNSRLAFFLSASFAGSLLSIANEPSGGLHLIGKSRSGKSTALYMAASVWGKSDRTVRQWRATSNGLEGLAKTASDSCLFLDEIGQAEGKEAGDTIYMLANGMGKQRATTTGAARETAVWNLLFLTTGEIGLADKMSEGNKTAATGLHIRLVNLDADAGARLGIFENLHGKASAADLADHLKLNARTYYGVAAEAFLREISSVRLEQPGYIEDIIESFREKFRSDHVAPDADGQVLSVAARFSLVAAAGEVATVLGILPWKEGEAIEAAGRCFSSWLRTRGHSGAGEDEQAIVILRTFIVAHSSSRFSEFPKMDDLIRDRAGWWKKNPDGDTDYLFQTDIWPTIFKGSNIDPERAIQVLDKKGLLLGKAEGRKTARPTIGSSRPRVYWVSGRILDTD